MKNFFLKTKNYQPVYRTGRLKTNKGFTLLFAILVSVLVLSVGASMITIALKQVILSGAGRESQYAFYAANTGAECAIYWDLNGSQLINGNIEYVFPPPGEARLADLANVQCGGGNITTGIGFNSEANSFINGAWDTTTPNQTTFKMVIDNNIPGDVSSILYCVEVTVKKEDDLVTGSTVTTITSQGLNGCDPDNDARAVQRGLVLRYQS